MDILFSESKTTKIILTLSNELQTTRILIIEWLYKIYHIYKFQFQTFLLSVRIFDIILSKYQNFLDERDIHLYSTVSIFISVKFYEVNKLSLDILYERIGNGKFSKEDIIFCEIGILKDLCFNLPQDYFIHYIDHNINKYDFPHSGLISKLSESIYTLCILDFRLFYESKITELLSSVLYISSEIILNAFRKDYIIDCIISKNESDLISMVKVKLDYKKGIKIYPCLCKYGFKAFKKCILSFNL